MHEFFLDKSLHKTHWEELQFDDFLSLEGPSYRSIANRNTYQVEISGITSFIKIHHGIGIKEWLKCLLYGKTPIYGAENEYRGLLKLNELGLLAAKPYAYGKRGLLPIYQESYIAMEAILPSKSLETLLHEKSPWFFDPLARRRLIKTLGHISKTLHQNFCYHQDFYICHFLMKDEKISLHEPKFYILDLHRLLILKSANRRLQIKDLAGLYFSVMSAPLTQRDLFRFLSAYTGSSPSQIIRNNPDFWQKISNRAKQLFEKHHV